MKKVLVITYYWPPSGGGGVQRWVKFVKYLKDFGIEPIVLTVDPKFASYPIVDKSLITDVSESLVVHKTKSFEPLKLYKGINPKKEIPFGGFANEQKPGFFHKVFRFIRGNVFIPDARIGWNKFAFKEASRIIEKYNIDTIITTSPPHSTQLVGRKLKRKYKVIWIADLRDPWTDIYYYKKLYHTFFAALIDKNYERSVLNEANEIIVVSDSIKKLFQGKVINNPNKIHVIPNGFDSEDFTSIKRIDVGINDDHFKIVYTGTIADNYNIDGFIKAISDILSDDPHTKFELIFVGRVSEKYVSLINESILKDSCIFIGHVDHETSISYIASSDMLFLSIPDVPDNDGILTGKLFEYLASRKTIIGVGPVDGDASKIISDSDSGKMFAYNDVDGLKNYLAEIYTDWQKGTPISSNTHYLKYSRKILTEKLSMLIK